jgi:hypothetical protein
MRQVTTTLNRLVTRIRLCMSLSLMPCCAVCNNKLAEEGDIPDGPRGAVAESNSSSCILLPSHAVYRRVWLLQWTYCVTCRSLQPGL